MGDDAELARPALRALAHSDQRAAAAFRPNSSWTPFDGISWLAVVPFHMTNVAPRAVPALPWVSAFEELNVRTYVTCQNKPGVYFFSLDAANLTGGDRGSGDVPSSCTTERRWRFEQNGGGSATRAGVRVALAEPTSRGDIGRSAPCSIAAPGTLQYFLTERYCLYTVDHARRVRRLEIHHPPWPLQPAEASIEVNTMPDANGITLPTMPPLLHFAKRQDVVDMAAGDTGSDP